MIALLDTPLDPSALLDDVADPEHGGTALFVGTTRAETGLHEVTELRYEAANRPDWIDIPLRGLNQLIDHISSSRELADAE